jgi:AcrR family transcriptional regulator
MSAQAEHREASVATTPKAPRRAAASDAGADTRDRLIDAARACLQVEGIAGVSARAIARHGELNQALVFYHYGSVDGLLQEVARIDSDRRAQLYATELAAVATLAELVAVGRRIHQTEAARGSTVVLSQLLAGAHSSPALGEAVHGGMTAWTTLVEDALGRVLADTPLATVVPIGDIAYAIASLFLGLELMGGVDGDTARVDSLFTSLDAVSALVDALLRTAP